ncbi:MAG: SDR family NAD(P)-dependent oxidoreductase [Sporichthyaceae bacterium]
MTESTIAAESTIGTGAPAATAPDQLLLDAPLVDVAAALDPAHTNRTDRPLALVTAAAHGIGYDFALHLADEGYDLVLTAAEGDLGPVGAAGRERGAAVEEILVDLATPAGVDALFAAVTSTGRPLEVVVLNTGVGLGGAFADQELDHALQLIDLDVRATVHLTGLLLPLMLARASGRLLLASSNAATTPHAQQAVHTAARSFTQSFADALAEECAGSGVTVSALLPN